MANSRSQSPIEVNFKRVRNECPTQSDDFDVGDGAGIEDLPIMDLNAFTEQGTLNQQVAPMEKVGVSLHEALPAEVEQPDVVVTAIFLMPDTFDDLVEVVSIQSIPTSLASLFCNLKEDWV